MNNIPTADAQQEQKDREQEQSKCLCYRGHAEDCPNWDSRAAYYRLQGCFSNMQEIVDGEFSLSIGINADAEKDGRYFLHIQHPDQDEIFTGAAVQDVVEEFSSWMSDCDGPDIETVGQREDRLIEYEQALRRIANLKGVMTNSACRIAEEILTSHGRPIEF